jgi:hypothetical protein
VEIFSSGQWHGSNRPWCCLAGGVLACPPSRLACSPPPTLPSPPPLAGLNSEQLALLDFLILARSHKFVGFGPSTFSTYLREHRTLHGTPPARSLLVNASRIGTDAMFARSALVASRRLPALGGGGGAAAAEAGKDSTA